MLPAKITFFNKGVVSLAGGEKNKVGDGPTSPEKVALIVFPRHLTVISEFVFGNHIKRLSSAPESNREVVPAL